MPRIIVHNSQKFIWLSVLLRVRWQGQLANPLDHFCPFWITVIYGYSGNVQCILIGIVLTHHMLFHISLGWAFTAAFAFVYYSVKYFSIEMVQNHPTIHYFMLKNYVNLKSKSAWMTSIIHSAHIYLIFILYPSPWWGRQQKTDEPLFP